jgi:hypothetical protein
MKAKRILLGSAFFILGMLFTFGIGTNGRHHHFNHQDGIRKSTVIEVGAPLTVKQLKHEGFL